MGAKKSRRWGVAVALGAAAAVIATTPTASAGQPAAEPAGAAQDCNTVRTNWTATAQPHAAPEGLLNAYSNTGKGWTGADSTYSVPLSGGRTAWIFSFLTVVWSTG